MKSFIAQLMMAGVLAGCGAGGSTTTDSNVGTSPAGPSPVSEGEAPSAPPVAEPAGSDRVTIQGNGFSFQVPGEWKDVSEAGMTIVSSPVDVSKGDFGTRVSVSRLTNVDPARYIEQKSKSARSGAQPTDTVEVTEVTLSGITATRIDSTIASPVGASMSIDLLIPIGDGVLQAGVMGPEEKVRPHLETINAILESLQVQ